VGRIPAGVAAVALEGEPADLKAEWREADEIAAIADALTLPERVLQRLERLTDGR
jgi:hypothetical protein